MLQDKHILLGVSGGIAVYKAIELASLLTKAGAQVKTIMTANAMEFVSPLSFKSITKQSVSYKLFDEDAPIEHISLADWADIFIIAPATANIIGKIANGIADDLLSTSIMAGKAKKIIVPAMNINMYENPIVQKNITFLKTNGYLIMEPETGYLACGYIGKGRFPDPVEILDFIKISSLTEMVLQNKKVLITAGASREKIDPMRFISNRSSGKMGISLAKTAYVMGAEVKFIHAYIEDKIPYYIEAVK
ncbi:MAG TPA: bifunctional phosphopantothenoylcysteine decarboxylase/phosphopantothenate--cysteine ligase CoaBC, partial [Candidatus Cloacimonadota bacterium]|nr:bifunctional phosphopantothenoylcysteine decarboxylase/phosphopantothenate--cysteine ligase CoaBC [Candidatus Cloacimonadota bacterium]